MDNREKVKRLLELDDEFLTALGYYGIVNYRDVAQHYVNGGRVLVDGVEMHLPEFSGAKIVYSKLAPEIEYQGLKVRCNPPLKSAEIGQTVWHISMFHPKGYLLTGFTERLSDSIALKRGHYFGSEEDVKAIVKAKIASGQWES